MSLADELARAFQLRFDRAPERLVRAPGRVNLIGEHTDYNLGWVLPVAIQLQTVVACASRPDAVLSVYSANIGEGVEQRLPVPMRESAQKHWSDYAAGVAWAMAEAGLSVSGADLLVASDVPLGSGLSSSASFEVAVAHALLALGGTVMASTDIALLCQRAENRFVGVNSGVMDQFAAANGREGCALLLDCRSLESTAVPVGDVALVVCNSKVRHDLAAGEYNARRATCERAVTILREFRPQIRSLRDATPALVAAEAQRLGDETARRCRHVVTENARVLATVDALRARDFVTAGSLLRASHASLRDDYEVSCAELDILVDIATDLPGVFGARMTGGGFGGCTINLVAPAAVADVSRELVQRYERSTGLHAEIYVCTAAAGAGALRT